MTGNLWLDLLISFGGVAVLVGLSFALGGWRSLALDETVVRDRLSFDEPDFIARDFFVSADGKAAAAISEAGEAVFLFALGDGVATRRLPRGAAKVKTEGKSVVATLGDVSRGKVKLAAADEAEAARWAGRLKGEDYT